MSIASRTTSIIGHIEDDYNALERLGADLTSIDKNIENIASVVNNIYNKLPKVTGTGSDLSLTPTLKGGLNILPIGNCEQDSYQGYNIAPINTTNFRQNENSISSTSNSSGGAYLVDSISLKANVTYYFNILLKSKPTTSTTFSAYIDGANFSDLNFTNIDTFGLNSRITKSYTPTDDCVFSSRIWGNNIFDDFEFQYWVCEGTNNTIYEKYVGGIPSPNPSFPQSIKVVTGDNQVVVQNKNLYSFNKASFTPDSADWYDIEGNELLSVAQFNASNYKFLLKSGSYYFSFENNVNTAYVQVVRIDDDGTTLRSVSIGGAFTLTKDTVVIVRVRSASANILTSGGDIQIEKGSTGTTIIKGLKQFTTLHLGSLELCKIGDYQDVITGTKDNWKIVRNVGKVVYTGASREDWQTELQYHNYRILLSTAKGDDKNISCLSSYFLGVSGNQSYDGNVTNAIGIGSSKNLRVRGTSFEDVFAFRTWLSTHNLTVYYQLATPTEETITDTTLINELNELQELLSYDGTTNISITSDSNNAQMLVQVSALKGE